MIPLMCSDFIIYRESGWVTKNDVLCLSQRAACQISACRDEGSDNEMMGGNWRSLSDPSSLQINQQPYCCEKKGASLMHLHLHLGFRFYKEIEAGVFEGVEEMSVHLHHNIIRVSELEEEFCIVTDLQFGHG